MTDIRIRLIVVILLSLSAFTGVLGTLLASACWIVFCAEETFSHNSWKLFMPSAVLAAGFPGLILYLSGGDGGIYAAKIFVIFCLAFWLGVSHKPGEFLDLGVWALGRKTGFDLGLSAELTMQYLSGISDDLSHMRSALRIKGEKLTRKTIPSLATGLLLLSLSRRKTHPQNHPITRNRTSSPLPLPCGSDRRTSCKERIPHGWNLSAAFYHSKNGYPHALHRRSLRCRRSLFLHPGIVIHHINSIRTRSSGPDQSGLLFYLFIPKQYRFR